MCRDGLPPPGRLAGLDGGGAASVVDRDEVADEVTGMGPLAEGERRAQLKSPRSKTTTSQVRRLPKNVVSGKF